MSYNKTITALIILLGLFGLYCSLVIGSSWDEPFTNNNALAKINFIKSFGKNLDYLKYNDFHNPGFYEVILAFISNQFSKLLVYEIRHIINLILSFLTLVGVFLVTKICFDKKISLLVVLFCLVNPFFFGMMSITIRDMPICFAYVWSLYFCIQYVKNFSNNKNKFTIYLGLIIGFGLGSRLGFVVNLLPLLVGLIYFLFIYYNKNKENFFYSKILKDIIIVFFLSSLVMFSFWVNAYENPIEILINTFQQTVQLTKGPETFIINEKIYDVTDTPKDYFLLFFLYRFPLFLICLTILFFIFLFMEKNFFYEKYKFFKIKIIFNLFIILFPIFLIIFLNVGVYDDFRLFIFLIPFFSLFSALSFDFLITNFQKNIPYKVILLSIFVMFFLFLERFIKLTPYHYDFSNYLNINFTNTKNNYQHDFWATSYKELINKIKKDDKFKDTKFTISHCGGNIWQIINEFIKEKDLIKNVRFYNFYDAHRADYIIMINRLGFGKFKNNKCFDLYEGVDVYSVVRLGIKYSVLRKVKKN